MKEGVLSIPDSEGPIVFVIDDDPLTRGSLSSLFRSVGLNVKALASAAELLEIITRSGIPAGVFNLVVGSGSTSSPGSPFFPLRVCTNCCPGNGSSRAKPTNPPISKLPNLHAALL
jgi:CheY-like chemotaxis protein